MKYTVIAFQAALIVLIALLILVVALQLAGLLALTDPSATLIGGLSGAAAVGLAAVVGFNAQSHAARLQRDNAEAARKREAQGLAGALASEILVSQISFGHHISKLEEADNDGKKFSIPFYPDVDCPIFKANIARLDLLPVNLQRSVVAGYAPIIVASGDHSVRIKESVEATEQANRLKRYALVLCHLEGRLLQYALRPDEFDDEAGNVLEQWEESLRDLTARHSPAHSSEPAPAD